MYNKAFELIQHFLSSDYLYISILNRIHNQPSRDVLRKSCPENMKQIYRKTPMLKCDFNKIALHLY